MTIVSVTTLTFPMIERIGVQIKIHSDNRETRSDINMEQFTIRFKPNP